MLSRDLRFAIHALANSASYAIAAILTLALGVSAATTIFSLVDAVLLRPFPIPAVDRLVSVSAVDRQNRAVRFIPAVADFLDWREQNQTMERLTAARFWFYTLDAEPGDGLSVAEEIHGWRVSPGHLRMFGAQPMLGRLFREDEATPGNDRVAVITHGLWQRRFGAAPDIIGQTLRADSDAYTIVGVLSPDFYPFRVLGKDVELWLPLSFSEIDRTSRDPAIGVYGLLKPGVTLEEAQAEFDLIAQQLEAQYPDTNRDRGVALVGFAELTASAIAPRLHILSAAVGFVLLLACVNVAGLMLVRGAGRRPEFAVRLALGASRWRVMRQLLVENLVLSALGGALAVILSLWSIRAIAVLFANDLPVHVNPDVDWRVCAFAFLVAMATALVFGVIPALVVSSSRPADVLKAHGRQTTLGIGGQRFRNLMVVAEIGLTLVLLVTAGLLLQTMRNLDAADRGLDPSNRLTMQVRLIETRYDTPERVTGFYDEALARVRALPGVEQVAASSFLPISDVWVSTNYEVRGRQSRPDEVLQAAYWIVSDDFFETIGLPLQSGRAFSRLDHADAAPSAIVSRDLERLVWPARSASGEQLRMLLPASDLPWNEGATDDWLRIQGVADDYLWFDQLDQQMKPSQAIYVPLSQQPRRMMFLIAHTQGSPRRHANAIRNAIAQVDPQQPVTFVRTYDEVVQAGFETRRVLTLLLTTFAVMSVLLTLVGAYGLVAYQVSERTREFGIRLVLGASPAGLLRLVLGHARWLSLGGLGIGGLLSLVMTHSVRAELYGVGIVDARTYAAVSLLLLAIVAVATWVPARRAMTMEPVVVLRDE